MPNLFQCTSPACTYEALVPDAPGDAMACPLCSKQALAVDPARPAFACSRCSRLFRVSGSTLSSERCSVCGGHGMRVRLRQTQRVVELAAQAVRQAPPVARSPARPASAPDKIRVTCPDCNTTLNAPLTFAEKVMQCSKCKAKLIVPYPQAAAEDGAATALPVAEHAPAPKQKEEPKAPPPPRKKKKKKSPAPVAEEPEEPEEPEEEEAEADKPGIFGRLFGKKDRPEKTERKGPGVLGRLFEKKERPASEPAAPSRRVRDAAHCDIPDEARLASNESYRRSKLAEFAEVLTVAKEVCNAAGHHRCLAELDTILTGGALLMAGWPGIRPALERNPQAMFACQVMLVGSWSTPQSAIRWFGLEEHKPGEKEQDVLNLINVTASTLKQMLNNMGIALR